MTRLVVENIHRIPSRPWLFLTGQVEGAALHIGDRMTVENSGLPVIVRSIDIHGAPGKATIAVDATIGDAVGEGTVLTSS